MPTGEPGRGRGEEGKWSDPADAVEKGELTHVAHSSKCHEWAFIAATDWRPVQGEPRLSPGTQLEMGTSNPPDPIRDKATPDFSLFSNIFQSNLVIGLVVKTCNQPLGLDLLGLDLLGLDHPGPLCLI
ncbi:hypothetical protein CCH79_00001056 [Gambusia affinis]|uniref:Uncharacterized protein n=1 Tax=Gambusia affinis TaxID=33528 RepID=A0A315VUH4_GAMAF|nr:hypothetical protein CCH79_00001056 [Gambusia affinis]